MCVCFVIGRQQEQVQRLTCRHLLIPSSISQTPTTASLSLSIIRGPTGDTAPSAHSHRSSLELLTTFVRTSRCRLPFRRYLLPACVLKCSHIMQNSLHHCFLTTICVSSLSVNSPEVRNARHLLLLLAPHASSGNQPFVTSQRELIPPPG